MDQKKNREKGCMRCIHGKAFYCPDGKRIYVGADGSVAVYANGEYIDLSPNFKYCPWCGAKLKGDNK